MILTEFELRISVFRTVKRSMTVEGVSARRGRHELGMFVQVASSRDSFSKIALKSNAKHFS